MRNPHPRYMCFPSVVCVGKETQVTIVPRDNSRIFREEKEYFLKILGLCDDLPDYHDTDIPEHDLTVKDGCIVFTHTFESEQEYSIRFGEKDRKETRISLYAVESDLYERRPLKGDLHTHTYYSDGDDGLTMVASDYREEGFDFFALTDHNRMFTSRLINEQYKDVSLGMHMMTGEEIHTPGTSLHIVHIGGKESVCDKYIKDPDGFEKAVDEVEKTLAHIDETYRRRVAMAVWTCNEIHKAGGLAILAHPYWCPNAYNLSNDFINILFELKIFDALEVMGGNYAMLNSVQQTLWLEQMLKGNYLPVVGSSDSHNHDFSRDGFGRRLTFVFAKDNSTESILEAIRDDYSVAADIPKNDDAEIRYYTRQTRLALFTNFLYNNYFNETWRLCIGEGILMRRYAEGEDVGDVLSALADTTENFYKKFYGIIPAPTVTPRVREFLDRAREVQRTEGPLTKGSKLYLYGTNTRRE